MLSCRDSLCPELFRFRCGPAGEGEDASRWQHRVGQRHKTQHLRTAATGPDQRGMEMVPPSKAAQKILKCGEVATEVRAEKVVKEYSV